VAVAPHTHDLVLGPYSAHTSPAPLRTVNGGSVKSSTGCRTKADSQSLNPGTVPPLDALVVRVRGEYVEMPGLQLTVSQACRLWQVEMSTCERVLEQLVCEGFLYKTDNGAYIAVATSRG